LSQAQLSDDDNVSEYCVRVRQQESFLEQPDPSSRLVRHFQSLTSREYLACGYRGGAGARQLTPSPPPLLLSFRMLARPTHPVKHCQPCSRICRRVCDWQASEASLRPLAVVPSTLPLSCSRSLCGGCSSFLDRRAHQITPLCPGAIVISDILVSKQVLEGKPCMARSFSDSTVSDDRFGTI
jgi:hypothetical protein